MDAQTKQALIDRYNRGTATPADLVAIEQGLGNGSLLPEDLATASGLYELLQQMPDPEPSQAIDWSVQEMIANEREQLTGRGAAWRQGTMLRLAAAIALLVVGAGVGYWAATVKPDPELAALTKEVTSLRELMMFTMLEKPSASERLKAVSLSTEISDASNRVTTALLRTLNEDDNVNVRLAALDALKPYSADPGIRQALVESIGRQQSPLVQVALAELMAALQEKSSIDALRKLLESDSTPGPVKGKIKETINVLI
ncbi:MAG: HEAT repeat domain-containing protein [Cyclobacteriaceae bacterium]|nr:HEAT repeat domain-containing protein [Cyclobacteriaceae bacterium]